MTGKKYYTLCYLFYFLRYGAAGLEVVVNTMGKRAVTGGTIWAKVADTLPVVCKYNNGVILSMGTVFKKSDSAIEWYNNFGMAVSKPERINVYLLKIRIKSLSYYLCKFSGRVIY